MTRFKSEDSFVKEDKNTPLPFSWEEVKEYVRNNPQYQYLIRWADICNIISFTGDNAPKETWQHISFMKLILLRDIYRDAIIEDLDDNGWIPYLSIGADGIVCLDYDKEEHLLTFNNNDTARLFQKQFSDLISECKGLVY